jgi:hypothetical protein
MEEEPRVEAFRSLWVMSRTTTVFPVSGVPARLTDLLARSLVVVGVAGRLPRLKAFR